MDAGVITAIGGAMAIMGTGARFVWLRIEKRLSKVETDLEKARKDVEACKERHASDRSLLAEVLLVLQLVADEMASSNPTSPVLVQIHRILRRAYPVAAVPPDMIDALGDMR